MAGKEKASATKEKSRRPQAQKRDLQNEKRRARNRIFKSRVKTAIRHFEDALTQNVSEAQKSLNEVYSLMDRGVKKNVFKRNKASRTKARLSVRLPKHPS